MDAPRGNTMARVTPKAAKPNKAKPNKAKPNKAKPNKAKPNKAKPNKAKPNKPKRQRRAQAAKRLEAWARRLRAGLPIRVAGKVVRVPPWVEVETEFENDRGSSELEIEIKWSAPKRSKRPRA
jgi:amphi-Trp domain-containing protein